MVCRINNLKPKDYSVHIIHWNIHKLLSVIYCVERCMLYSVSVNIGVAILMVSDVGWGNFSSFCININVSLVLEVKTWLNETKEKTAIQYGATTWSVKGGDEKCFEVQMDLKKDKKMFQWPCDHWSISLCLLLLSLWSLLYFTQSQLHLQPTFHFKVNMRAAEMPLRS